MNQAVLRTGCDRSWSGSRSGSWSGSRSGSRSGSQSKFKEMNTMPL